MSGDDYQSYLQAAHVTAANCVAESNLSQVILHGNGFVTMFFETKLFIVQKMLAILAAILFHSRNPRIKC